MPKKILENGSVFLECDYIGVGTKTIAEGCQLSIRTDKRKGCTLFSQQQVKIIMIVVYRDSVLVDIAAFFLRKRAGEVGRLPEPSGSVNDSDPMDAEWISVSPGVLVEPPRRFRIVLETRCMA